MIRIQYTSGCPNNCPYCYEPTTIKTFDPIIPDDEDEVQITDMNFLANPRAIDILKSLKKRKYELVCGVDYRRLTREICVLLHSRGFKKIRWAWDGDFRDQIIHNKIWRILKTTGFKKEELSVFVLANWKVSYNDCCKKLELLKIWNVKVNDCCYDGGYAFAEPEYWTIEEIRNFRKICRKHNQLVRFKIDPELK